VLAEALIANEPLPVRFEGVTPDTVSHVALLVGAVHVMLDVTVMVALPPAGNALHVADDNSSTTGACVTVIVRVSPPPVTVTVAVLGSVPVLYAVAVMTNEPLLVWLVGLTLDTVSHVSLLAGMLHVRLDVTVIVLLPPAGGVAHVAGDNVSTAAACVTLIVWVLPPPATVIVAVREAVPVLEGAVIINEPLPVRSAGVISEMVSHP
jgi:hypothetical protein